MNAGSMVKRNNQNSRLRQICIKSPVDSFSCRKRIPLLGVGFTQPGSGVSKSVPGMQSGMAWWFKSRMFLTEKASGLLGGSKVFFLSSCSLVLRKPPGSRLKRSIKRYLIKGTLQARARKGVPERRWTSSQVWEFRASSTTCKSQGPTKLIQQEKGK